MSLPQHILDILDKFKEVEAPVDPTHSDCVAWVRIIKIFYNPSSNGPKPGSKIKPNAKYNVKWMEMSNRLYQVYLKGSDVTGNDAETVTLEFADDEDELERLLLSRLKDFDGLVPRYKNPIKYP